MAVGHEDSLELDCEGDSPKVQESADVKKALDLSPVINNNSTNASYHGGTALTPSRLRHLADEVEYIDQVWTLAKSYSVGSYLVKNSKDLSKKFKRPKRPKKK